MSTDIVKTYYGETLKSTSDLKTEACCTADDVPAYLRTLLSNIHEDVLAKYYGCGLIAPPALEGARILDLGCGSGRDVYALAQMVGETGEVVGVDMTRAQIDVARRFEDWHRKQFGFKASNVRFLDGYIEKLEDLDLEPASFDVIVSNCVVNLATDKLAVLKGAHHLLKPGGEFYFSDIYADRRIPEALSKDPVLYGECLSGALYWNDFLSLSREAGFKDPRLMTSRPVAVLDPDLVEKLGAIKFFSATYRLFRLEGLEPACEDYGQAVIYRGGIEHAEEVFSLDAHHVIEKGKVFAVCGNTWRMLKDTRFEPYFDFIGDFDTHYGIFEGCGSDLPFEDDSGNGNGGSCC